MTHSSDPQPRPHTPEAAPRREWTAPSVQVLDVAAATLSGAGASTDFSTVFASNTVFPS